MMIAVDDRIKAAYEFVHLMVPRADDKANLMWYGWALREAFIEGAKWQAERSSPEASKE